MLLQKIIHKLVCEDPDIGFNNNYSGRGMYSSKCIGITGTAEQCRDLITKAIKEMRRRTLKVQPGSSEFENEQLFNEAVDTLMQFHSDHMGIRSLIYYWPSLGPIETTNEVWNAYLGECADCGQHMPLTVSEGDSCANCSHTFYKEREDD